MDRLVICAGENVYVVEGHVVCVKYDIFEIGNDEQEAELVSFCRGLSFDPVPAWVSGNGEVCIIDRVQHPDGTWRLSAEGKLIDDIPVDVASIMRSAYRMCG